MVTLNAAEIELHLPSQHAVTGLDQDEEWCEIAIDGERRRIRLHDYAAIYAVPGLYERLFAERLECDSPGLVCDLLVDEIESDGVDAATLSVLDVGAGNGMVGELLHELGVRTIVGVDVLDEARGAALRDRPHVYDDYRVLDLCAVADGDRGDLRAQRFDCLTCVAALGFGDMPTRAWAQALALVRDGGWVAFNMRARFLYEDADGGFGALLERMLGDGVLAERARTTYTHRISVAGERLEYVAFVATKLRDVPPAWLAD